MLRKIIACSILLICGMQTWPQMPSSALGMHDEPVSFIGMKLDALFSRFGAPQTVYAARGRETWQDDVVFSYSEFDFFIYRDRVWQVGLRSFYNMSIGDAKGVALLVLGDGAEDRGDHIVYPVTGSAIPLSLCVNFNADRISAIYVYRPDY